MALENNGTPNPDTQSGAGEGQSGSQQNSGTGPSSGSGQPGQGSGNQPAAKVYTYNEDRSDYVPRHRLNEESGKRTRIETELAAAKQQAELLQKRLQIAMGVTPQDPKRQEQEEVETVLRETLKRMYPGIDLLQSLNQEQLDKVLKAAESAQSSTEHQWNTHTAQVYESIETETAKQLGVETLTPKQVSQIRRAYVAEAEACMEAREKAARDGTTYDARNDFMARHLRKDPSLAKEFVRDYLNEWYAPARRQVTAQQVRRTGRPVPGGNRHRDLTISGQQPVGNLDNKDDFKKALLAARNSGG